MRQNINEENIEGYLYQHNLKERQTGQTSKHPGTDYISGTIDVATTEDLMNVLQIHYTYVTKTTKSGAPNRSYTVLKRIIDEGKTVVTDGKEEAWVVRTSPSIALDDFYPEGGEELVSVPRNEGGFISIINPRNLHDEGIERNKFTVDALITAVKPNEEDGSATLKAAIFNFRNDLLPITLTIRNEDGVNYFLGQDISNTNPFYTKVWGKIVSTIEKIQTETESAFGEAAVDIRERRIREYVITGANKDPYIFGDGGDLTPEELKKAVEDRNVMLADQKQRNKEYYANRNASSPSNAETTSTPDIARGSFDF